MMLCLSERSPREADRIAGRLAFRGYVVWVEQRQEYPKALQSALLIEAPTRPEVKHLLERESKAAKGSAAWALDGFRIIEIHPDEPANVLQAWEYDAQMALRHHSVNDRRIRFGGREPDRCRFKLDEWVECRRGDHLCRGRIIHLPLTPAEVEAGMSRGLQISITPSPASTEIYADQSDDVYVVEYPEVLEDGDTDFDNYSEWELRPLSALSGEDLAAHLLRLEDFACFAALAEQARRAFSDARTGTGCKAAQIEPLACALELPAHLCVAYAELASDLRKVADLAQAMEKKYRRLSILSEFAPGTCPEYPPGKCVEDAKDAIAWINAVDVSLSGTLQGLTAGMRDPQQPMGKWQDGIAKITVMLEIEHSPERDCYRRLPEPIQFEPATGFAALAHPAERASLLGDPGNWNARRYSEYPLREVHMGYLAHCVIEHLELPWQLVGRLRVIETDLEVRASRTFKKAAEQDSPAT